MFIDAQGIAALRQRIRFRSILLLFFASLAASFVVGLLAAAFKAPPFAVSLISVTVADLGLIGGYQLLAYDRDWVSLRARFKGVRSEILWACAAGAVVPILIFLAAVKILMWSGIQLPPIPTPNYLLGGAYSLPAVFLVIVLIGPAAEEILVRGLLLDWLRQEMPVWPAILISALIFGLLHGIALHSGLSGWLQFSYRIALGILAAYLAVRYQSLRPSFVLHATNNLVVVIASAFL
ncbi:MAG TPA: type II CAAX endopeptidase family protein [Steroidobacteraceae bacterium]